MVALSSSRMERCEEEEGDEEEDREEEEEGEEEEEAEAKRGDLGAHGNDGRCG